MLPEIKMNLILKYYQKVDLEGVFFFFIVESC